MFGRRHPAREDATDETLSSLMREWRGVEPQAGFEAAVWRRIRSDALPRPAGVWESLWDWLLPHPVLAGAAAAAVALIVGSAAALVVPGRTHADQAGRHALLLPGTVAGSYLALSEGRRP